METTLKNVLSDAFWIMPATPKYKNQGIPYITSKNIKNRRISFNDVKYIDKADYDVISKNRPILENDILISMIGTLGEVAVVQKEDGCFYGQNMYLIRLDESKISQKYFLNWVESDAVKRAILQQQNKSTQSYLKAEHIEGLLINVPNMIEQDRIAVSLEKINAVIEKRKQQLQKLDEFVKAQFVEMFGDPICNPKGWSMPLIEDIVAKEKNALKAGPFGSALKKEYYTDSGYKIYGQEQVINGDHKFGDYYIDTERYKLLENCAVKAGDVLISLVGTYGKSYVMPEEFEPGIINPRLMKITFDKEKINPYYFQHYFQSNSLKKALAENTHGGTMDILNLSIVRKLAVPLPPLELQNEFIAIVKQVDKSKLSVQKSLDKLEILKKVLMQKYFG